LVHICNIIAYSGVEIYTLQVILSPGGAIGGEVFSIQPKVAIYNSEGLIAIDFSGSIYAEIGNSPSNMEKLYIGSCDGISCGQEVKYDLASAIFKNGIASFKVMFF
jgi:hypothetical protein